jgi:drug/metabolite transporter (DMT)-like permease
MLAAAASLGYGVADFVGGLATRQDSVWRVLVLTAPVSLVVELALLPLVSGRWSAAAVAWGAAAGLASAAAFALLYQSLALGPMGVLSPITAVVSAVLPAGFGIIEGERLDVAGIAGIVLAIAAVIAVSAGSGRADGATASTGSVSAASAGTSSTGTSSTGTSSAGTSSADQDKAVSDRGRRPSAAALGLAVAAGATIAAMLVCLAKSPHDSGLAPLISCRAVSAVVLLAVAGVRGQAGLPGSSGRWLAAGAGLFDALGNVAFLVAVRSGSLVVVAVITALYPGGTVLLARQVLGERLTRTQLTGLLAAAVAVSILAVG